MHTFNFSALKTQTPISQGFIFCFQTVKSFKYLAQRTSLCPMPKAKCQDDCTIKVVCKSMVIPTNAAMIKYSYNILIQIQCDAFMTRSILFKIITIKHTTGLLRYVKLRVVHAPGMPGTFSQPPRVSDPNMHQGTCETHMPWCMPGSLTN